MRVLWKRRDEKHPWQPDRRKSSVPGAFENAEGVETQRRPESRPFLKILCVLRIM
jgi:hypothetical protein